VWGGGVGWGGGRLTSDKGDPAGGDCIMGKSSGGGMDKSSSCFPVPMSYRISPTLMDWLAPHPPAAVSTGPERSRVALAGLEASCSCGGDVCVCVCVKCVCEVCA
jgi:hypothetical protein